MLLGKNLGIEDAFSAVLQSDGCSHNDLHTKSASKKVPFFFNPFNEIISSSNSSRKYYSILCSSTVNTGVDIISRSGYNKSQWISTCFCTLHILHSGKKEGEKTHSCFHNTVLYQCLMSPHPPCCPAAHQPDSPGKSHGLRQEVAPSSVCGTSGDILQDMQDTREAAETLQQSNKHVFSKIHLWHQLIIIS